MALKFSTNVAKRLKLKFRKFWVLIITFVEVTREKLAGGFFTKLHKIFLHKIYKSFDANVYLESKV